MVETEMYGVPVESTALPVVVVDICILDLALAYNEKYCI
jgi:hypothetical protein